MEVTSSAEQPGLRERHESDAQSSVREHALPWIDQTPVYPSKPHRLMPTHIPMELLTLPGPLPNPQSNMASFCLNACHRVPIDVGCGCL